VSKVFAFTDVTVQDDGTAIEYLFNEDIVDGYDDGTFKPQEPINRAELLKILVESRVSDVPNGEDCFADVLEDWYASYVCYAKDEGWVEGYSDGSFGPGKNINRAEAIAMLFKVYADDVDFSEPGEEEGPIYLDVSESAWYANYLYTGREMGVLVSESYFYPENEITRGDMASALYHLLISLEGEPADETEAQNPNPFSGVSLYVDPDSNAYDSINSLTLSEADANDLEQIASQPGLKWFGDWNSDIEVSAEKYVSTVTATGALPVTVLYNIPGRDCENDSAEESSAADDYLEWVQGFADGVGDRTAVVILEPDALPMDCLYGTNAALLGEAVDILKSKPGISVYLDAGHANWISASEMALRLEQANVQAADGFSLNVSNFYTTEENIEYGEELSALIEAKHFIIDTSRNGNGSNGEWCNPSGMSLGQNPTVDTGNELVDAYLWVKPPGESDGTCNGGPSDGGWWLEYALGLVRN